MVGVTAGDAKHKATRNECLCKYGCRCNYGSCSNGNQPKPPTISGVMCTQPKPCLRCMDACVSTNGPTWSVNRFYLMVRRRGIKCVHLPDLFLSDGNMKKRHQMCSPAVDPPCVGEDVQCFQTYLVNFWIP